MTLTHNSLSFFYLFSTELLLTSNLLVFPLSPVFFLRVLSYLQVFLFRYSCFLLKNKFTLVYLRHFFIPFPFKWRFSLRHLFASIFSYEEKLTSQYPNCRPYYPDLTPTYFFYHYIFFVAPTMSYKILQCKAHVVVLRNCCDA